VFESVYQDRVGGINLKKEAIRVISIGQGNVQESFVFERKEIEEYSISYLGLGVDTIEV
jgi:hypothetical protein